MDTALPFFIAGGLLLLTWILNRFLESLLRKELENWTSERVPLHEGAEISAPVSMRPIVEAMHEELAPELLMMRVGRNNDCVAIVISGLSLVIAGIFLSESFKSSLLPVLLTVVTFVLAGVVYLLRPKVHDFLSFRGLSLSNAGLALINVVVGLLLATGIWSP